MSKEYQNILEGAMTLPKSERFALIQAILDRSKEEFISENISEKMSWETDEFFTELDRRVEELGLGKIKPIPGEEVMAKLKKKFK